MCPCRFPWRVEMLGGLRVVQSDRTISRFQTQKTGALLAYLALNLSAAHSREVPGGLAVARGGPGRGPQPTEPGGVFVATAVGAAGNRCTAVCWSPIRGPFASTPTRLKRMFKSICAVWNWRRPDD